MRSEFLQSVKQQSICISGTSHLICSTCSSAPTPRLQLNTCTSSWTGDVLFFVRPAELLTGLKNQPNSGLGATSFCLDQHFADAQLLHGTRPRRDPRQLAFRHCPCRKASCLRCCSTHEYSSSKATPSSLSTAFGQIRSGPHHVPLGHRSCCAS